MRHHGWVAWTVVASIPIIAIAGAYAIALHREVQQQARLQADQCTMLAMRVAIANYYRVHGTYPEHPEGLASCPPLTPLQAQALAEVRRMVDETARVYRVTPVSVMVARVSGVAAFYLPRVLLIAPATLTSPDRDATIAHELAHDLLGHASPRGDAPPLRGGAAEEAEEMDANVKSVELLARVKAWPERVALEAVYRKLLRQHRAVAAGQAVPVPGHAAPCTEINDLLRRFPQHRGWTARLECSEPHEGS